MKAHRTDLVSFAFGLLFVALSAWWLLAQLLGLVLPAVGWFLAGALIMVGVLGLVGALRSGRSPGPPAADGTPAEAPSADGTPTGAPAADPGGEPAPTSGPPTPMSGPPAPTSGPPAAGRGPAG